MNWTLLQNSLTVAAGSSVLATLWGMSMALFAVSLGKRGRNTVMALAVVTFALPPFLVTNTLPTYFGLAGTLREYIPFELFSLHGTILLIALQFWPAAFLFIIQGLLQIERDFL